MRAFATAVLLVAAALAQAQTPLDAFIAQVEAAYPGTPSVTATAMRTDSATPRAILVDVREPRERAVSVLPGSITPDALARPTIDRSSCTARSGCAAPTGRSACVPTVG